MINRSEVSRALAKAIAFKNCGRDNEANAWAAQLVKLLECADILSDTARHVPMHQLRAQHAR